MIDPSGLTNKLVANALKQLELDNDGHKSAMVAIHESPAPNGYELVDVEVCPCCGSVNAYLDPKDNGTF
jgi:hypothetical protein